MDKPLHAAKYSNGWSRSILKGADTAITKASSHNSLEAVIVSSDKDRELLRLAIRGLIKFANVTKVTVVGPESLGQLAESMRTEFVNEDCMIPGLTLSNLRSFLDDRAGCGPRAGWYFQQFLKMWFCWMSAAENYLIWDADTVLLRPTAFINPTGNPYMQTSDERHLPYYQTFERLFGFQPGAKRSFVTEHMVIESRLMQELIREIHTECDVNPQWVYRVLNTISDNDLPKSGFSEFETYGNYRLKIKPLGIEFRQIASSRHAAYHFGCRPNVMDLTRLAKNLSYASFESRHSGTRLRVCYEKLKSAILYPVRVWKTK